MTARELMIILVLLGSLYSLILKIVQRISANNPTPENLKDVYDAETYEKWKKYTAEHCRLGMVSTVVSCIVTIIMLCTNLYSAFASLFPFVQEWQIFAVILLEAAVSFVFGTVEKYVATMKIEQKYGFNRSSVKTFVFDRIRVLIFEIALSFIIAYCMALGHTFFGIWMIPAFAAIVFIGSLFGSFLSPLLGRVGNKLTPLPKGELRDSLVKLLDKYGYKVREIQVMDASKRTTKSNAYFTGIGKSKTIVLYDNLVNTMSTDEITAIFAHELGHGLHKDIQKNLILNIFQLLFMASAAYVIINTPDCYLSFGFNYVNYGFTYILLGIVLSVLRPVFSFIMNAHSRKAEFKADRQAVIEGYGEAMISAFKKLARNNFSHLSPSWINVVLEYSHPPLKARIKNVERCMRRLQKQRAKRVK